MAACLDLLDFLFLCFELFIHQLNDVWIVDKRIHLSQIGVYFKLLRETSTGANYLMFFKAALYTSGNIRYERTIL